MLQYVLRLSRNIYGNPQVIDCFCVAGLELKVSISLVENYGTVHIVRAERIPLGAQKLRTVTQ